MIEISRDIKTRYAKAFRSARKDKMRVVWLEDNLIYVARRKRGHDQYLVRLFVVQGIDGEKKVKMNCNTITGGTCQGCSFRGCCSHMAAVIIRSEGKRGKKEEERAA